MGTQKNHLNVTQKICLNETILLSTHNIFAQKICLTGPMFIYSIFLRKRELVALLELNCLPDVFQGNA